MKRTGEKIIFLIILLILSILCIFVLPVNSKVQAYTFEQRQDHFNPENKKTFTQRFWVSTKNYINYTETSNSSLPSSSLLYISDFCDPEKDLESGAIEEWSEALGAIGVELEVRYAGQSQPVQNFTTFDLQFQTFEQNIADLLSFLSFFSSSFPSFGEVKWVVIGEYLQGNTAMWAKEKNEKLFAGAVAIAPPAYAYSNFFQYQSFFSSLAGKECAEEIHNATYYTEVAFTSDPSSAASIKEKYGCTGIEDNTQFMYVVGQVIEYGLAYHRNDVCANLSSSLPPSPSPDDFILSYSSLISSLLLLSGVGNCSDWDLAFDNSTVIGTEFADYRPTFYLDCTALGQFETAGSEEGKEGEVIVSGWLTEEWYESVCVELFGEWIGEAEVNVTNLTYGGKDHLFGSNFSIVSTTTNPFHFLSPTPSSISSLPFSQFLLINTSQTFWEFLSAENGGEGIMNGRAEVLSMMEIWLGRSVPAPPPMNYSSVVDNDNDDENNNHNGDPTDGISPFWIFVICVIALIIFALVVVGIIRFIYLLRKRGLLSSSSSEMNLLVPSDEEKNPFS